MIVLFIFSLSPPTLKINKFSLIIYDKKFFPCIILLFILYAEFLLPYMMKSYSICYPNYHQVKEAILMVENGSNN